VYSYTLSLTSALFEGLGGQFPAPGRFIPPESNPVPLVQEAGWDQGPV